MTNLKQKSQKIDGVLTVVSSGGCIVGCMSWETPFIKLKDSNGNIYLWVSDKIEELGYYCILIGTQLKISAFVRKETNHLFRVKAELVG